MKIFFSTKKIENICNSDKNADKKLGKKCAKVLHARLRDLAAVKVLCDFKYGCPHPLKGSRKGQFAISLEGSYRLVFKAVEPIPKTKDGAIDWKSVKVITIIFIGDYHE